MNSYEKINYKLRPQKRIERALFSQLINNFEHIIDEKVNYIGMGSLYYTDFIYFYKNCNFNKMISIESMYKQNGEKDEEKEVRFNNNKPLNSISLIPKHSRDAIEELPLDENNFIWLDYDGQFVTGIIEDLEKIIKNTMKTSIFAISFNDNIPNIYKSYREINIKDCYNDFVKYASSGVKEKDFSREMYSQTVQKICEEYLVNQVEELNKVQAKKFELKRISKIEYQDGVKMITLIWAYVDKSKPYYSQFERNISKSEIVGVHDLSMEILTLYEKQVLDRRSNEDVTTVAKSLGLSEETIKQYYKFSKYIPEYTEVIF